MTKLSHIITLSIILILIILFFINIKSIHPIFIIIILISYRLIICFIISIQSYNYILSIILFLIIIRGLLIIFLYFARLISNEQNKFHYTFYLISNKTLNLLIIFYFLYNYFKYPYFYSLELIPNYSINTPLFLNIFKIFNYPFNNLTILCIIYLLITLFSIIKICSTKSSPLRKLK